MSIQSPRYALVGLFFIAALVILGAVTLNVLEKRFALGGETYVREIEFVGSEFSPDPDRPGKGGVGGLERGDSVRISGVEVGQVVKVRLESRDPAAAPAAAGGPAPNSQFMVRVWIELRSDIRFRQGYRILIVDSSLLGGKLVEVDPGYGEETTDIPLRGRLLPSALASLSEVVDENRERINAILSDVSSAAENVRSVTDAVKRGEGTVGRLLTRVDLHERIREIVARVERIATSIDEGDGVLAALLNDRKLRDDLADTVASARDVAGGLQRGEGTLGRLIKEDGPYRDLERIVDSARELVAGVERGEGTIGVLFKDDKVAGNIRRVSDALASESSMLGRLLYDGQTADQFTGIVTDTREIIAHVRAGKGTVGQLLMDDSMAASLQTAVRTLTGTINEARESAPVNAFLQTLFIWW